MFGSCSKNKIFYCPHAYNTRIPAIYYLHSKGFSPAQDPDFEAMLPGGQERLMARQFSIKCMSILKIITRNGLEKRGKMKI
jgi:hypothetical protein